MEEKQEHSILIVQTGGTIDKDYPKAIGGYSFEMTEGAVKRVLSRVILSTAVEFVTVCSKDSQDIGQKDRKCIAAACSLTKFRKIIITHGTDTMLETASYLSKQMKKSDKIIVLTGAQKPETFKNSDADFNVGVAFGAVQCLHEAGVYIAMSGCVYPWHCVSRNEENGKFELKGK